VTAFQIVDSTLAIITPAQDGTKGKGKNKNGFGKTLCKEML
jgi:hypothetical protein